MRITEVVSQAWDALITQRFRAALTMMGIAWGIVTVVLMMAYGNGFHRALMIGFYNAFTPGTFLVRAGQTSQQAGGERAGRRIVLKEADVDALRDLGSLKAVTPESYEALQIAYRLRSTSAGVRGITPEYGEMRSQQPQAGRFISHEDVENRRRVAFLGSDVARKLFGTMPPVGETIRIAGLSFEVIGVLRDKVTISNYFFPDRESVFIPFSVTSQLWYQDFLDVILFQPLNAAAQERAVRQVREVLATRHRFDPRDERAVLVRDSGEVVAMLSGITTGLRVVLSFIGTLTLLIGGVGVMNIMLVSVTERTREIGIRKSLGARRRHILTQFLLEALAITFLGGAIGVLMAWGLVQMIEARPFLGTLLGDAGGETDIHLMLSPDVVVATTAVLVATGVLSGMWPAIRASRLDPIEALRYE